MTFTFRRAWAMSQAMGSKGWIGVDLDGTLAHYDGWKGPTHIGAPVPAMVERVKRWIAEGREVRIFTARIGGRLTELEVRIVSTAITAWCMEQFGQRLEITNVKDFGMIELWDDRATQVQPNTGIAIKDFATTVFNYLDIEDPEKFVDWIVMAREIIAQHNARLAEAETLVSPAPKLSFDDLLHKHRPRRDGSLDHICPRSIVNGGKPDAWLPDDSCSYCGSLDPDVFMARLEAGDVELVPTDKSYKVYVRNAGGAAFKQTYREMGSPQGDDPSKWEWTTREMAETKFYFPHLTVEQRKRFLELYNEQRISVEFPGYFYVSPFFMAVKS